MYIQHRKIIPQGSLLVPPIEATISYRFLRLAGACRSAISEVICRWPVLGDEHAKMGA